MGGKGEEVGRCEGGGGRQKGRCTGSDRLTHFILFNLHSPFAKHSPSHTRETPRLVVRGAGQGETERHIDREKEHECV